MNAEQSNIAPTVIHTLHNGVITNMDKYMQEAEKAHKSDDNYFNTVTRSTNTSPVSEIPSMRARPKPHRKQKSTSQAAYAKHTGVS